MRRPQRLSKSSKQQNWKVTKNWKVADEPGDGAERKGMAQNDWGAWAGVVTSESVFLFLFFTENIFPLIFYRE